jgi:hypothetical protein
MPYREKIAWLSLIAMAITFGPYFVEVAIDPFRSVPLPNLPQMGLFAATTLTQALILGLGRLYLRIRSSEDARTPPDERDLAIERRSIYAAYFVLLSGMIFVGCVMPFTSGGWKLVNAAVAMIVLAELTHYGVVAVSYRRQA